MTRRASPGGLPHLRALDGLRGLAVLGVLLHHARIPGVPAGFVGVDVFFVLSGFLITSLLLAELRDTGRVRLGGFWLRRARRLLPALFAVVLVVGATAPWWLEAGPRSTLVGDGVAALVYVANWRILASGTDYFATFGPPSPLTHTWSLGVEEQFYVLWPLAVVGAVALLRRLGAKRSWRRRVVVAGLLGTLALVAGSALLTAVLARGDVMRAYYGTDARAQELLGGAALGLLATAAGWWGARPATPSRPRRLVVTVVGLAGLVGLVVVAGTVRDARGFVAHGGFALVTALAAAVLVAAVHPVGGPVARLLAWRPLAALGVVSYGVYLWHWPLFVLLDPVRTGLDGGGIRDRVLLAALRIGTSGAVAVLSYRLVERPARTFRWADADPALRGLVPVAAASACLAALVVPSALVPPDPAADGTRFVAQEPALPTFDPPSASVPPSASPSLSPSVSPSDAPTTPAGPTRVFLLGDSSAFGLHSEFPPSDPSVKVSGSTQLGCDLLGGELLVDGSRLGLLPVCRNWPATWRNQVTSEKPDVSVLVLGNGFLFDRVVGGRTVVFGTPEYERYLLGWLDDTLDELAASSGRVVVTDVPCFGKRDTGLDGTATIADDARRQRLVNRLVREHLAARPQVRVLDLRARFCPGDRFAERVDGVRLRPDGVHWSREGAAVVWGWLIPEVTG